MVIALLFVQLVFPGPTIVSSATPREELTARQFGAVGDGVTDDTAALQAALNASADRGLPLVTSRKIYRISQTLYLRSGTTWVGGGAILRPDGFNAPLLHAQGQIDNRLSDIHISGLYVDGRNKPPEFSGGFGSFRFTAVSNLTVRDVSWENVHEGVFLRAVEDFTLSGLRANDLSAALVALLRDTRRGTISDLVARNVNELMDLAGNEDISVTNFLAHGNGMGEGFDMGNSRRISISNGTLIGFRRGVLVKTEGTAPPGMEYSWEDLNFSNITIMDHLGHGMNFQSAGTGYGPARRIKVRGVTIRSEHPEANGVDLRGPVSGAGAFDADFDGLLIDVPGVGFYVRGWTGTRLRNSKIRSGSGFAVYFDGAYNSDVVVSGCDLEATGGTTTESTLTISQVDGVRLENTIVHTAVGYAAVRVRNSKRPSVQGITVTGSSGHGIFVEWSSEERVDRRAMATIRGNTVRDWGKSAANRLGIAVSAPILTEGEVQGLDMSDNVAILSEEVPLQGQIGFSVSNIGDATLNRSRFDRNMVVGATAPYLGMSNFGAGCSKFGNLPEVPQ